jgi:hypothetical protein
MSYSYRKVGGLHFVRIGRFGFSFYIASARRRRLLTLGLNAGV